MMRKLFFLCVLVWGALGWGHGAHAREGWIASWGASLIAEEPRPDLEGATIRTYVRLTAGGEQVRLRFSNAFGTRPLRLEKVTVALAPQPGADRIDKHSLKHVRFAEADAVTIPQGAESYSDPVDLSVGSQTVIAVTYRIASGPGPLSANVFPRSLGFISREANGDEEKLPESRPAGRLYLLAGADVLAAAEGRAIAIIGDSITSAGGASVDGRGRWTDVLASRIAEASKDPIGVLNLGVNGGRVASDGSGWQRSRRYCPARPRRPEQGRPRYDHCVHRSQ
jgi:hypothetical protein